LKDWRLNNRHREVDQTLKNLPLLDNLAGATGMFKKGGAVVKKNNVESQFRFLEFFFFNQSRLIHAMYGGI